MAANTHLIGDKETNNWFKAYIGLNVTKEGLTNFLCAELQKVHTVVGRSCGNCPIENLIQCPTNPYCNKRKRNYCPFHKSQKPQPCPICDNVKDNIILHHRYGKPSWRNTRAEKWAQNDWEIGKCYLPPDGYSSISSMQESDFNGVINIMLNCLHFQTCLSPLCLSPPPPDKQCPLEKVRQIGRDVRHTSDCKVTDADLQDYFKTLSTLLADPQYLQHDPSAIIACTRLSDLQNDRMSFEELGKLLKEANHTLEDAKKAGECFSEKAKRTLEELEAGLHELSAQALRGKQDIQSATMIGCNTLISTTEAGVHELKAAKEDIVAQVKKEVRDFKTNGDEVNYSKRKEMLLDMMIEHYDNTLSTITTSPLQDGIHAMVDDIYMPPKLQLMEKVKGAFEKTHTTITKYSNVLLKDGKYNRKMFIQGEAGSGKSTFLAILVREWCCITSKASGKQFQTDETYTADANARLRPSHVFGDLTTLKVYTFVFHVTLRDSVNELNILEMLKKQIIDSIYGDKDRRENAYRLLNDIMERERCLVLLDGLDEWTCNKGKSLPELAVSHRQCDVLITTRPWKLTEAMIPDSKIDMLLQLEGVNKPFEVSIRLLGCMDDCKDSMMLDKKQSEFESYIMKNDLEKFLISPMLLQLIVHSWIEGTEMNGSMCEIYSLFLESLLKKANKEKRKFQSPPVQCFKDTEHIRPNIENVDRLAKAAFHLLFSNTRESSLVFSDTDLERFGLDEERKEFAFKSGILSATRKASALRSSTSFSFIHKSIQEFLTAYYIACNTHLIDDFISGYLNRYDDAYMDISQVFIFLCGLEISAADKLSSMMNERDVDSRSMMNERDVGSRNSEFPSIILSGYREAVANKHYDSNLKLSHFKFFIPVTEIGDVNNIWIQNRSNILSFQLHIYIANLDPWIGGDVVRSQSSYERGESASHYEFDLSSCSKLKQLVLEGPEIWLKESACSSKSKHPVWIVLNSRDPLPALPCIERIHLTGVTISSRVLRGLLSSLLTLDHEVTCVLHQCSIASSVQGSNTNTGVEMIVINNTLEMEVWKGSRGLWEALHSLNTKSLSLICGLISKWLYQGESISPYTPRETLTLEMEDTGNSLWEALHSLNIKSLILGGEFTSAWEKHGELLSTSLSSLTQLETLTIHLRTYIVIQPPQSLKNLIIYCHTLLPSQLRDLTDTLRACTQTIESRLEFGCAMLTYAGVNHDYGIQQIAPEEYIPIVQELETLKNVAVKRFRILDRTRKNRRLGADYHASCWSVRSNGDIDDDKQNGDNFKDKQLYREFVRWLHNDIIHRISMRLLITSASTSGVSNQYCCNT